MNTEISEEKDGFGTWRKSSFSEPNGNACVEVAWRTSSCVVPNVEEGLAVAAGLTVVGLRDSKNTSGPTLIFDRSRWSTFIEETSTSMD